MTRVASHPSIERRLSLLRSAILARQRVLMRVARACPVSMSASNRNNIGPERQLRADEGAREGSVVSPQPSDQEQQEANTWILVTRSRRAY
jgi:hypothetical protein